MELLIKFQETSYVLFAVSLIVTTVLAKFWDDAPFFVITGLLYSVGIFAVLLVGLTLVRIWL